jgi:hypothetical protein
MGHRFVVGDDASGEGVSATLARRDFPRISPLAVICPFDRAHPHDAPLRNLMPTTGRSVVQLNGNILRIKRAEMHRSGDFERFADGNFIA